MLRFDAAFTSCVFAVTSGLLWSASIALAGPYAPPAGIEGSTAIGINDERIVNWASGAVELVRGPMDIRNPQLGLASFGSAADALGPAEGHSFGVVSLGDGGSITLTFPHPIADGPGYDFAVFENGFSDAFLELAFVEVSSNGGDFIRFPAVSLTPATSQVGPWSLLDATNLHNLAGKYGQGHGVPFDLAELAHHFPLLDVRAVTHVRLIDVVGSIDPLYATYDSLGNKVNDPFPTSFATGGFDLDAVAVLHQILTPPGDFNGDGIVNTEDINAFIVALTDAAGYAAAFPGIVIAAIDPNNSGWIDTEDINHFITLLTGGSESAVAAVIPEPGAALVFLWICCAWARRRWRFSMTTRSAPTLCILLTAVAMALHAGAGFAAIVVDFEDMDLSAAEAYSGQYPVDGVGGDGLVETWISRDVAFQVFSDGDWGFWQGFAASRATDTTTPGFTNAFSAVTGAGVDASAQYAIADASSYAQVFLPVPTTVLGAYFTNTTYAYLSMLHGDMFAKAFGGPDGTNPDWLLLMITGHDAGGQATGSVALYLADYRNADGPKVLMDKWTWVDLQPLGDAVASLSFAMASSDVGPWGMNTPGFFAMDNLIVAAAVVPEPATAALLLIASLALPRRR